MSKIIGRGQSIINWIDKIENETEDIVDNFGLFSDGTRVIMLLERTKDGGHNKERKRIKSHFVYRNSEEFKNAIRACLILRETTFTNSRIYLSVNRRDIKTAIRNLEENLLDMHYSNDEQQKLDFYDKVFLDQRTHLMQQNCRVDKNFLLDIDDQEGVDVMGEVLKLLEINNITELYRTRTKNGWHIITEPFNPVLLGNYANIINKDGLILIKY